MVVKGTQELVKNTLAWQFRCDKCGTLDYILILMCMIGILQTIMCGINLVRNMRRQCAVHGLRLSAFGLKTTDSEIMTDRDREVMTHVHFTEHGDCFHADSDCFAFKKGNADRNKTRRACGYCVRG